MLSYFARCIPTPTCLGQHHKLCLINRQSLLLVLFSNLFFSSMFSSLGKVTILNSISISNLSLFQLGLPVNTLNIMIFIQLKIANIKQNCHVKIFSGKTDTILHLIMTQKIGERYFLGVKFLFPVCFFCKSTCNFGP